MKPGLRKEARLQGLIYYNNGRPCKYGHLSDRRVKDGVCLECDKNRYSNPEYRRSDIAYPRKYAISQGLAFYSTGIPCKNGHISIRRTRDSQCIECEKMNRNSGYYEKYNTDESAFKKQFGDLKGRARAKGIPFSIELKDIERPEFCPVLGTKLNYGINHNTEETKWKKHPNRASFDKVIPSLGYIPGNVFIISLEANRLKSNASLEQLESLVAYMKRNKNGQRL